MQHSACSSHRVLVAEDNTTNSLLMQAILVQAGYRCTLVRNGELALDRLVQESFDIAALDVQMPNMSGIEVVRAFRFMRPQPPHLPLILFSADASAAMRAQCRQAGANAFLAKPIRAPLLLETLALLQAPCGHDYQEGNRDADASDGKSAVANHPAASKPGQAGEAMQAPVLDRQTLAGLEQISREPAFLDGLLAGFVADNGILLKRLAQAQSACAWDEALNLLHALKGAALSVGASAFGASCRQLHQQILDARADAPTAMRDIERDFDRLCQAIMHYRRQRILVA